MPANHDMTSHCGLEPRPRRGLLRWLPGAVMIGALGLVAPDAAARKRKKKPVCERCPKYCETPHTVLCKPRTATESCACAWTTTGRATCVNIRSIADTGKCKATNECQRDVDCGSGQACILVDDQNCCSPGKTGNLCLPVCSI